MTENQQNKSQEAALQALRQDIDKIDDQILSLLKKRMEVIAKVGELKKNNQENFFIRSSREADMIKNLVAKTDSAFPKSAIVSIWRKIITAANMHEQPLRIAIHNPKNISDYEYLVKEYYSDAVPIFNLDSSTNVVAEIEKGEVQIGIFALPKDAEDSHRKEDSSENWWIGLANNRLGLKVFAMIPMIQNISTFSAHEKKFDAIHLVAVAIKKAEKSSSDNSLIYVELSSEFSKSQLLSAFKEQGISAKILKSVKMQQVDGIVFYLLECEGFFEEEDEKVKTLKKMKIKPYVKVLGHYATPIILPS
jgi:chorismate mutase/prephenate dehydratase